MRLEIHSDPPPLRLDLGDQVRVGPTRVTLQTVMYEFLQGLSAEEIVARFPTLSLADVYATIAYYFRHRDEVDAYLKEVWEEEERAIAEARAQQAKEGIRERLEQRRRQMLRPG